MSIDELLEELSSLTILEALELVKKLEKRWGVSSIRQVSKLFTPLPQEPEPQTEFDVVIKSCGPKKIEVIKAVRWLSPDNLGLKEAKDAAECPGYILLQGVDINKAMEAKRVLEEAGATIEVS
jgi:large subunit ribosomal protein L7/L12